MPSSSKGPYANMDLVRASHEPAACAATLACRARRWASSLHWSRTGLCWMLSSPRSARTTLLCARCAHAALWSLASPMLSGCAVAAAHAQIRRILEPIADASQEGEDPKGEPAQRVRRALPALTVAPMLATLVMACRCAGSNSRWSSSTSTSSRVVIYAQRRAPCCTLRSAARCASSPP